MIDKWVIQETHSKEIVEVIHGTIDDAFALLKEYGDDGKGYSLTSAPLFMEYKGVKNYV